MMDAFAQEEAASGSGGTGEVLSSFIPLILIFLIFYFFIIRPQQKKVKQHRDMISSVKKGDKVVTSGGVSGTVKKVADEVFTIEIAEKVEIKVKKSYITEVES